MPVRKKISELQELQSSLLKRNAGKALENFTVDAGLSNLFKSMIRFGILLQHFRGM